MDTKGKTRHVGYDRPACPVEATLKLIGGKWKFVGMDVIGDFMSEINVTTRHRDPRIGACYAEIGVKTLLSVVGERAR